MQFTFYHKEDTEGQTEQARKFRKITTYLKFMNNVVNEQNDAVKSETAKVSRVLKFQIDWLNVNKLNFKQPWMFQMDVCIQIT